MIALSNATLPQIADRVAVPGYDRSRVTPGIVHIGVGGFHRAHQARYLDRLMGDGFALDFGIVGVGLLPSDAAMRDALVAQDCLYTLVEKPPDGPWQPRVIGSIVRYLYGPDDPGAVIAQLADPAIRIVSLTITEGGYNFDQVTGNFVADNPAIVAELAPGAPTSTVFGYLYQGLRARRAAGLPPFTVMSCDNIQSNGEVAKRALGEYAVLRDPAFARWIEDEVHFPSSMVDRITPQTTDADRADVAARFGVADAWPVVCESFTQWALTDDFPLGRPAYERVGVQVVDDVLPFELMKLRLLNCSHKVLAYLPRLAGFRYVHDAAGDPDLRRLTRAFMDDEVTSTVPPVPGEDLEAYKTTLIERFSNPNVRDTVDRLCLGGSQQIPKWFPPMIAERLGAGQGVRLMAAVIAAWARYCEGVDDAGQPIPFFDTAAEELTAAALRGRDDPLAFLRQRQYFGDLVDEPRFTQPYLRTLDLLHTRGATETIRELVGY